jgi:hypothetical protein
VRAAGEPRFDLGCLMGGVVIHDDMDIEAQLSLENEWEDSAVLA